MVASVQGIGGVFIDSNDAVRLARWYEDILGVPMEAHPDNGGYYHVFSTRDVETSILRENPVFAINQVQERLPEGNRGFVLNLRVDDLYTFLDSLRAQGVSVEEDVLVWERGKHGWIRDLDGNRIELYEAVLVDDSGEER